MRTLAFLVLAAAVSAKNVVFILTDDQDVILNSLSVMPKLMEKVASKGAQFSNAFVNTPICCPSRATYQTGRYMHNTGVPNNQCGETAFHNGPERRNMAALSQAAVPRLRTFFNGKYLNNYPSNAKRPGGSCYSPIGWDRFYGLVGNSKYYNYDVCLCQAPEHGKGGPNSSTCQRVHHGSDYATDYYTDLLANDTIDFIREVTKEDRANPFLAVVHTPAPHVPNICAPQYCGLYNGTQSPRVASWNKAPQPDKHWLMRQIEPMNKYTQSYVSDGTFIDRWRALQSVDDLVERLMATLEELGRLNETTIIYSSDHGQHLGEFGEAFDKREPYETDVRVPLLVRGPGIAAGQKVDGLVGAIDIVPTILSILAPEQAKPEPIDGDSWLPLVNGSAGSWVERHDILIEYNGPTIVPPHGPVTSDPQRPLPEGMQAQRRAARHARNLRLVGQADPFGVYDAEGEYAAVDNDDKNPMPAPPGVIMCGGERGTTPCDAVNNTYACIRSIDLEGTNLSPHSLYCQFNDDEDFVEFYTKVNENPWELTNEVHTADPAIVKAMADRLRQYQSCSGDNCRNPHGLWPPAPPAGSKTLKTSGMCLAAVASSQVGSVKEDECYPPYDSWILDQDALGFHEVKAAGYDNQCLNLNDVKCAAGTLVHLHDCQGTDKSPHTGDRWQLVNGQIEATPCPGMCASAAVPSPGSDWGAVTLQKCGSAGTTGWVAA